MGLCFWSKRWSDVGVFMLVSVAFWIYADARTTWRRESPVEQLIRQAVVDIHYPVETHSGSSIQYDAGLRVKGGVERVLLSTDVVGAGYGDRLVADVRLRRLSPDNSYRRYLLSEGYGALGRIERIYRLEQGGASFSLVGWGRRVRARLISDFEQVSASVLRPEVRGVTYALALGDRSQLPVEIREGFRDAGVAHVLAVSGYHLGVIFFLLSWVVSRALWRWRHRQLRYLLLMGGTLGYTLLTGCSTATVRAFVMSSLVLLASLFGRRTDKVQLLSLTLLIFLIHEPMSYLSVGLMLSVSAVWGILTFLPLFRQLITPSIPLLSALRDALFVSVSAQIGVLPFLFLFFGRANLGVVWSNIPLMYLSALAIPYGLLLVVVVGVVGSIPSFLLVIQGWLVEAMIRVTQYFSIGAPYLSSTGEMDLVQVVLYYSVVLVIYRLVASQINARTPARHILDEKVGLH